MATVGIMHSGSQNADGNNVTAFKDSLQAGYAAVNYVGPLYAKDLNQNLSTLANQLLAANVDILVAAGGSRSAEKASTARGNRNTPIILFTSVAPYIGNNPPQNMTGVCAHTSDHDVARLNWLIQMQLKGNRIGVLRNSDRGDQQKQIKDLQDAAGAKWVLRPRDINIDKTLKESFAWLKEDIQTLLVAADPFFNENRNEVVTRANSENYPAIFQWREFVTIGGLMSYGPKITNLYQQAGTMAASILNTNVIPGVWSPQDPGDFELVVNKATAQHLNMWPLPQSVGNNATVI
jgi:putative tryptophan/tyrosine transport system substrate-binding protein